LARPRSVSGCHHPGPRRVFSSCRHQSRVRRDWIAFRRLPPLLEAPPSFEKVRQSAACTVAISTRTSHGVRCSPSALAAKGARFTRRFHPPARSVLGDSHPFDGFLRPSPERACFIPPYAPGVRPVTAVSLRFAPSRDIAPRISWPLSNAARAASCFDRSFLEHVRRPFVRRSSYRGPSPGLSPPPWQPGLLTRASSHALRLASIRSPGCRRCWCFGVFTTEGSGCSRPCQPARKRASCDARSLPS